jgi:Mce-associated membrane protein
VSKHTQDETTEDNAAVTSDASDTDIEKAEDEVTDESTEKVDEPTEVVDEESPEPAEAEGTPKRGIQWARVFAYEVLPVVALLLAMGAGYLKWMNNSAGVDDINNTKSPAWQAMQTAKDSTIAMLSYKPDTVDQQLNAARDLLTGDFRNSYTSLITDVVIPGAKQKQISAVATVPAVASVTADPHHAVVLVFVNQTVVVGQDAPTDTASSVRVTLEKTGDRWLISKFDPV